MTDNVTLSIEFSFDPASGLFNATLQNGARFNFALNNVTGKLGANLALLRDYSLIEVRGSAPRPKGHDAARPREREARLVKEAIAAGKLQRVGVIASVRKGTLTLEELGL